MVTISDDELLERAKKLFVKLGGMRSEDGRLVRALIERITEMKDVITEINERDFHDKEEN